MLDRLGVDIVKDARKKFEDSTIVNKQKLSIIKAEFKKPKVVKRPVDSEPSPTKDKITTTKTATKTTKPATITTEDKNCVTTTVTKELYTNCTEGEDLEDQNCTTTFVDEEHNNCTDVIVPTTRRSRCAHKRGGCHWNAKCFNWGKKCRCKRGFYGDGKKSCKGTFEPKFQIHFISLPNIQCLTGTKQLSKTLFSRIISGH